MQPARYWHLLAWPANIHMAEPPFHYPPPYTATQTQPGQSHTLSLRTSPKEVTRRRIPDEHDPRWSRTLVRLKRKTIVNCWRMIPIRVHRTQRKHKHANQKKINDPCSWARLLGKLIRENCTPIQSVHSKELIALLCYCFGHLVET